MELIDIRICPCYIFIGVLHPNNMQGHVSLDVGLHRVAAQRFPYKCALLKEYTTRNLTECATK